MVGASLLVPFFAALCGAHRTRLPNWHLEPTAETHVPVVEMFRVVLCSGVTPCAAGGAPPAAGGAAPYTARFLAWFRRGCPRRPPICHA